MTGCGYLLGALRPSCQMIHFWLPIGRLIDPKHGTQYHDNWILCDPTMEPIVV